MRHWRRSRQRGHDHPRLTAAWGCGGVGPVCPGRGHTAASPVAPKAPAQGPGHPRVALQHQVAAAGCRAWILWRRSRGCSGSAEPSERPACGRFMRKMN